jgi:azurin
MALFKSKTVSTAFITAILPVVVGGMLAGCNKKEEKQAAPATQAPAQAEAAAPIIVTGNDQMQFSTKAIEVKAGSEVVIIFQNAGTMAKEVMGHNLTILKPGTDLAGFATKAMTAKDTDYLPQSEAASVFAHTRLLGPGESDTLRFTPAVGEYPYLCTFPGHFAVMQGILSAK